MTIIGARVILKEKVKGKDLLDKTYVFMGTDSREKGMQLAQRQPNKPELVVLLETTERIK